MTALVATKAIHAPGVLEEAPPFRRLLVAIDASSAAQGASELAAEWASRYGADVRVLALAEPPRHGRGAAEPDAMVAGRPVEHVEAGGSTRSARNRQLARAIAEASTAFGADVILVGVDHRRLAGHRLAPSLREQLARVSPLPVLVVPTPAATDGTRDRRTSRESGEGKEAAHVPARRYAGV